MTDYPERPGAHVIGEEAVRIFRAACDPHWIVGNVQPDYGLDLKIEVTHNGQVTGQECYVQVKGSRRVTVPKITNGLGPIVPVRRSTINYWLGKLNPVLLVLVDVENQELWYGWVDGGVIGEQAKELPKTVKLVLRHRETEVPLREAVPMYLKGHFLRLQSEVRSLDRHMLTSMLFHVSRLCRECVTELLFLQFPIDDYTDENIRGRHQELLQHFTMHEAFLQGLWHEYAKRNVRKAPQVIAALESRFLYFEQIRGTFIRSTLAPTEQAKEYVENHLSPEVKAFLLYPDWKIHYFELLFDKLFANLLPTMNVLEDLQDLLFQLILIGEVQFTADTE